MLFYQAELFQAYAAGKAASPLSSMMDIALDYARTSKNARQLIGGEPQRGGVRKPYRNLQAKASASPPSSGTIVKGAAAHYLLTANPCSHRFETGSEVVSGSSI